MLEVEGLVVHYGKALAREQVSLGVEPGELVGVLGPNGASKTTLLKAISRTVVPTAGSVRLNGRPLDGLRPTRSSPAASAIALRGDASFPSFRC